MTSALVAIRVAQTTMMAAFREVKRYYEDNPKQVSFAEREMLGEKLLEMEGLFRDIERLIKR